MEEKRVPKIHNSSGYLMRKQSWTENNVSLNCQTVSLINIDHNITDLSIQDKDPDAKVTPWCPENCIITEWSPWSKCYPECIVSSVSYTSLIMREFMNRL